MSRSFVDRHSDLSEIEGTSHGFLRWFVPERSSCFWPGCVAPPAALAQPYFRRALVDPPAQEVTAEFLVGESGGLEPRKGTAWKVHYARGMHKGLYITGAWYKRNLGEDWIKILADARIAELFVPYHQSSYTRYFDLTGFSFPMAQVREEDAGPNGSLMPPFQGDPYPDRGPGVSRSRRGLERLCPRRAARQGAGDLGSDRSRELHVLDFVQLS